MSAELVEQRLTSSGETCTVADCRHSSTTVLENDPLCLEHFFSRCYEALQCFDGCRDHTRGVQETERTRLRRFLEECSTQALKICLRNENLNNLERSRLLDVLLWAGELSECVRRPGIRIGSGRAEPGDAQDRTSGELPRSS